MLLHKRGAQTSCGSINMQGLENYLLFVSFGKKPNDDGDYIVTNKLSGRNYQELKLNMINKAESGSRFLIVFLEDGENLLPLKKDFKQVTQKTLNMLRIHIPPKN